MIHAIQQFYNANPWRFWLIVGGVVSNAVSCLPTPTSQTGFYRWFFDFSHALAMNIGRVLFRGNGNGSNSGPGIYSGIGKAAAFIFCAVLAISATGCAILHKQPLEVTAYRTVVGSKAFLDSMRASHPECAQGAKSDLCLYLGRAVGAKDSLIDTTEIYCSGPGFESGGPCEPKAGLAAKVKAAISYYNQTESDLRKAVK